MKIQGRLESVWGLLEPSWKTNFLTEHAHFGQVRPPTLGLSHDKNSLQLGEHLRLHKFAPEVLCARAHAHHRPLSHLDHGRPKRA